MNFILINFGLSYIITQSYLFEWFRNLFKNKYLSYLMNCIVCLGFWSALIISFFIAPTPFFILNGFIGSACNYIIFNSVPSYFK
jgi:hypothetical protein